MCEHQRMNIGINYRIEGALLSGMLQFSREKEPIRNIDLDSYRYIRGDLL